ncbi:MAG: S46 family peptidase [Bacteroidales bacterium]|jgi:hypothetical protein|nr:S46 family peptidase [Bacteroidales bacterium]
MKKALLSALCLSFTMSLCIAKPTPKPDEGMWLPMFFKQLNYATMQKMGLHLTAEQLYSFNNSSLKDAIVQMGNFCTGEIVSDKGLMFTNHHCGYEAIASQSTIEHDYLKNGFWASSYEEELPIEGLTVSFLVRMDDVTQKVLGEYAKELNKTLHNDSINARIKRLQEANSEGGRYVVDVKPFFEGLEYYMFIYETFKDVRLAGAPPSAIGKFGGDTDNWMWPRHTGDFSIFRVYADKDNKPAAYSKDNVPYKPKHFLPVSIKGVDKGDFTMIWGYPGSTERYMTSYEVKNTVDISDPAVYDAGRYMLPTMKKCMDNDEAVRIAYASDYASMMNLWKNKQGELRGLKRLDVYGKKKAIEERLEKWINTDNSRKERYGNVFSNLKAACSELANSNATKYSWYGNLGLMTAQRALLAFRIARSLDAVEQRIKNNPDLDDKSKKASMAATIEALSAYGNQHFVSYDQNTEKEMFRALITMLNDKNPVFATKIAKAGGVDKYVEKAFKKSVFATQESFDRFMKKPNAKTLEKDLIADAANAAFDLIGVGDEASQKAEADLVVARQAFVEALRNMDPSLVQYPDANFTMRMTYGQVLDYFPADAIHYDYITTAEGIMEKEDPTNDEFIVPDKLKTLIQNKDFGQYADKNGKLVVCFLSNNDITGGNSGSPIINGDGQLIGLAFDGNWEAMSGDIAFEPELQRTINVDVRYVLFIIDKFAGAKNLIDELTVVK